MNLSGADVLNMISSVGYFTEDVSRAYNAYGNEPSANSIARQEIANFPDPESVRSVHYGGLLSMENAADHLMVFAASCAEPAKTVAPWTCVRGLLESCALAVWFLDPAIDVRTRVSRHFAFRHTGFVQQIKLGNVTGRQQDVATAQQRMHVVEQEAVALGYPRLLNASGDIRGIAQVMPNITELVGATLDREAEYRLLSAVAHGHHWATHQIGFRVIEYKDQDGEVQKGLEKRLDPHFVLYAAMIAVSSFAKVLWNVWRLYGWSEVEIKNLLDFTYDRLNYTQQTRFWRT